MHLGTIVAFIMALIGFVLGFIAPYAWIGTNFLLGSVALLLFLILRESTLSHIRVRGSGHSANSAEGQTRYHAARQPASPAAAEAATTESSPPASPRK